MARAFILVLDSLGIGAAADAAQYGDSGANTLLHIAQHCAAGKADSAARQGPLQIPNLIAMGLGHALHLACGEGLPGQGNIQPIAGFAAAQEISAGKDTPSGHWEMMGVPVMQDWGMFAPCDDNCFPAELLQAIYRRAGLTGSLSNCHASGTDIINRHGAQHCAGGLPIFYTSVDSVFQVACHETSFGLDRLYALCEIIREEVDAYRIGRVIARPFSGNEKSGFHRTQNRRDYTTPPHEPTLFDQLVAAGGQTIAIGKIADIFAHQAIQTAIKAHGTEALFAATLQQLRQAPDHSLTMTNFVDFDQTFGHRRDVAGYANELELFDRLLPQIYPLLCADDMLVITADHGCDPSWHGNDHTREYVPQLIYGPAIAAVSHGMRGSFADLGQTVAHWLGLSPMRHGQAYKAYNHRGFSS